MNKRTNERTNEPTILKYTGVPYSSLRFYAILRVPVDHPHYTFLYACTAQHTHIHFSHGNENGCLTHVTFIISCDLFLRLQFQVPVSVLTHFSARPSHSLSLSFIRRFLCPYTQCVNLLFLCFQTKNYPTASVIPCIREHVLCSHIYTRRNLMYNMLTDCFPSVIYFHSF